MSLEFGLIIIIAVAYFFGRLARKTHLSEAIGLIAAGLIITIGPIREILIDGHEDVIASLANFGLLALMFLSGFEISGNLLFKQEKNVITITFFTIITSLILGTTVMLLLGYNIATSLVMGICFGITSEASKAKLLIQLKKMKTKLGTLLMGTGIINDTIGIIMFVLVVYVFTKEISFSEIKILGAVILAFIFGVYTHYKYDRFSKKIKFVEKILIRTIVPFFFIHMGILFSLSFSSVKLGILLIVIITAMAGQMLGVMFSKPLTGLSFKQLFLVGWGMNSKGAVELAIAFIAFQLGFIPASLYSALVVATLVATIMFQIIIMWMVKRDKKIMN